MMRPTFLSICLLAFTLLNPGCSNTSTQSRKPENKTTNSPTPKLGENPNIPTSSGSNVGSESGQRSTESSSRWLDERFADRVPYIVIVRTEKDLYYAFLTWSVKRNGLAINIPKGAVVSSATIPDAFPNPVTRHETVTRLLCCQSRAGIGVVFDSQIKGKIEVMTVPTLKPVTITVSEYIDAQTCDGRAQDAVLCRSQQ